MSDPLDDEHEEHENHERYLITYADMITLLLALFIILFAIGQVDLAKYERFKTGVHKEYGVPGLEGGTGVLDGGHSALEGFDPAIAVDSEGGPGGHVGPDTAPGLSERLEEALHEAGLGPDQAAVAVAERGVVVVLSTDDVTFASGSWDLEPGGVAALDAMGPALGAIANQILVEGHTDDRPMSGPVTNWELSSNRAASVVRHLHQRGIGGDRLSIAGYGETRPVAANDTPAGRARNRRVEIVVTVDDLRPDLPSIRPAPPLIADIAVTPVAAG